MITALSLVIACVQSPKTDIIVLAAASLKAPFTEITREFEAETPSAQLQISYAGSQELAAQINLGAPADAFFSADYAQMDVVVKSKKVEEKQVKPFAGNELSLLVSKSAAGRIKGLADLQKKGLKISMAGEKVPVGAYTRQVLRKASAKLGKSWLAEVEVNTVSLETNVSTVFSRVETDEVDAGFVYRTDAIRAKNSVSREIPKEWNVKALYYVVVPKNSENASIAEKLVSFVLGKKGQAILAKNGFRPPK